MLARMAQADAQAVVLQHAFVERENIAELALQRRRVLDRPVRKAPADLSGQPGLALRAAADHHRVGAGLLRAPACASSNDRMSPLTTSGSVDRIAHRANGAPSRRLPL